MLELVELVVMHEVLRVPDPPEPFRIVLVPTLLSWNLKSRKKGISFIGREKCLNDLLDKQLCVIYKDVTVGCWDVS